MKLYTYFLTAGSENQIREGAFIHFADLLPKISSQERWAVGEFGDGWVRLLNEPETDADGLADAPIGNPLPVRCTVRHPGTHPCGRIWWLEPTAEVYVLVRED